MIIPELRKTGILIASNNPHKVSEIESFLEPFSIPVKTPGQLGIHIHVEENGNTFYENARLKVDAFFEVANIPTIADDSGLEVDALRKEPGVHSAYYGGANLTDEERNKYLLDKIKNVPLYLRNARFVCVVAFRYHREEPVRFYTGITEGRIAFTPRGKNGFGYDPIFEENTTGKTFAELTLEEKNSLSHRAKALKNFLLDLQRSF